MSAFNPLSPDHHARELLTEEIMVMAGRPADDPVKNRETLAKSTLEQLRELRDAMLEEVL